MTNVQKGQVPSQAQSVARYVAKYVVSPPIAVRRIDRYDGQRVTYHYRSHRTERVEHETVAVDTFIGRMVQHTMPKGFKRIRYYGVQAPKTFAKVKGVIRAALAKVEGVVKGAVKIIARLTYRQRYEQKTPLRTSQSVAPSTVSPPLTFTRAVELLDTIPGVDQRGAEVIVAESGTDMSRFETAPRLAAWAGVAPGNDESAGKQRSGKTRKGNRPLWAILTQLAHAAVRTKDTYLSALYQRLAVRRGKKRAIIAVAHSIMRSVFHMLSRHEVYRELGANYFDERRRQFTVDRLTRRIEHLGYRVHLEPVAASAA